MAKLNKEAYERKDRWAERRMEENSKIETLTSEQHRILAWLCWLRHEIHTNQGSFFNAESTNYNEYWSYIENDSGESEINNELKRVGLSVIHFDIDVLCYRSSLDYDYDCWEDEMSYEDAFEEVSDMAFKFNNKIEAYLSEIDKNHGTDYCPCGSSRIF